MGEIIEDAATIQRLQRMAGIDPTKEYTRRTPLELARYKFAREVLASPLGCQAVGTEVMCAQCRALKLEQPMCQMRNDTITVSNE